MTTYKTKTNISFQEWIDQGGRFTRGDDTLIQRNFPENTLKSGVAEISVDLQKPIYNGLDAIVTYKQYFVKTVDIQQNKEFNIEGLTPTEISNLFVGETLKTEIDAIIAKPEYSEVTLVNVGDPIYMELTNLIIINPIMETVSIDTDRNINVLVYRKQLDYATISALLKQVDPLVDPTLEMVDRIKPAIDIAVLKDIVGHNTFNLTEDQWELVS